MDGKIGTSYIGTRDGARDQDGLTLNWVDGRWDREFLGIIPSGSVGARHAKSRVESVESVELPYTQLCTD